MCPAVVFTEHGAIYESFADVFLSLFVVHIFKSSGKLGLRQGLFLRFNFLVHLEVAIRATFQSPFSAVKNGVGASSVMLDDALNFLSSEGEYCLFHIFNVV